MDEEMEVFMLTTEEPMIVAGEFEVDLDYEFEAPQYYDFNLPETQADASNAELWFDSATSYPPSPFIVKLNWRNDFSADFASVSCNSRRESMTSTELCSDMDQDVSKSKTMTRVKSCIWKSSTLTKPTASHLAKHSQLQEFHFNQFLRSQKIVRSDKGSQNSSTTESHASKRQKLEAGFLCKVSHLKHQTHFLHKIPVKVGLLDVNLVRARSKVTVPREPNLETAHRAQRHRVKIDAESGEHEKSNACNFKALPLNRKVFQLRTSERARQHARNNVATLHNYNSLSQSETKDFKRLNSANALKEKCRVQKVKAKPLNRKISSGKGELGIFQDIRKNTTSIDYNFSTKKGFLNEIPIDLFSKLSLASEVHPNLMSKTNMPLVSKDSKEKAPESFLFEHENFTRNQYQCGSESSDRRITEGGSRFNVNRLLYSNHAKEIKCLRSWV